MQQSEIGSEYEGLACHQEIMFHAQHNFKVANIHINPATTEVHGRHKKRRGIRSLEKFSKSIAGIL